ncbi:hypothetical protein [Streptomyces milbemycinicus]|uniref:hypothetical protein n=1 Tax=Streptomyces milbemycinicus TaxID=476552 RepID=UPI00340FC5D5
MTEMPALSWSVAVVAALVSIVSLVRMVTTSGGARFAAGGDLLMGACMAAMALPATMAWYAEYPSSTHVSAAGARAANGSTSSSAAPEWCS